MRSLQLAGILNFVLWVPMAAGAGAACGGSVAPVNGSSGSTIASGSSGASSTGSMAGASSGASGSISSGSSTSGAVGSGSASAGSSGSATSGSATSGGVESGSATAGSTSSGSATSGASSGTTGDACSSADCAKGACWLQLDGVKACINPIATPTLAMCFPNGIACCSKDADCAETNKTNPRCLPLIDAEENFCGGAIPAGNVCRYDQCSVDADCTAQKPAGATVAACVPSGAFGLYNSACVYGGCRTDVDCTRHPGGQCQYGLAATNGVCNLVDVLFCAYPSDPCQTGPNGTTGCVGDMICVPNADYQGRQCGKPPPAYP